MKRNRLLERHTTPIMIVLLAACLVSGGPSPAKSSDCLSPTAVTPDRDGEVLYIALATADRIAVVDVASGQVTREIPVAEHPVGLAISPQKNVLYVTSAAPQGLVQTVDLTRGVVTDTVAVGHTPVSVVTGPSGKTLYICNQFSNNVGIVDLEEGRQVATVAVPREPVAAALTPDGRFLFVANHLPAGPANTDYTASQVSVIDTVTRKIATHIELADGSTCLQGLAIAPDGQHAYITHILARYKFPTTYIERGWVNTNAMTIIDVPRQRYVNTVLLDDVHRGAANPYGVVCTEDGMSVVVSHAGTHELSVIDRPGLHARLRPAGSARDFASASTSTSGRRFTAASYRAEDVPNDLSFMTGIRRRLKLGGNGPRGLALIGTKAYTTEYFSDSLGVVDIDPDSNRKPISIPLGETPVPTQTRQGERLFHDASPSFQTWHSCASCHSGNARACGLNWDLLNDGMLNAKNTKSMLLTHKTPPAMATGARANAEVAVRSGIRYIQFAAPRRENAEALDAYLKSLKPVASPYLVNGQMSQAARRGQRLFSGQAGCANCHAGPLHTDGLRHNIGTETEEEPRGRFDTPTLVEVWRTAPYLHDGRATTVREVLTRFNQKQRHGTISSLTEDEISDLVEYVLTR